MRAQKRRIFARTCARRNVGFSRAPARASPRLCSVSFACIYVRMYVSPCTCVSVYVRTYMRTRVSFFLFFFLFVFFSFLVYISTVKLPLLKYHNNLTQKAATINNYRLFLLGYLILFVIVIVYHQHQRHRRNRHHSNMIILVGSRFLN